MNQHSIGMLQPTIAGEPGRGQSENSQQQRISIPTLPRLAGAKLFTTARIFMEPFLFD
jgi:hypothetical protein